MGVAAATEEHVAALHVPVHDAGLLVQVPQRGGHTKQDAVRAALPEVPVRYHRRLRDAVAEHQLHVQVPRRPRNRIEFLISLSRQAMAAAGLLFASAGALQVVGV